MKRSRSPTRQHSGSSGGEEGDNTAHLPFKRQYLDLQDNQIHHMKPIVQQELVQQHQHQCFQQVKLRHLKIIQLPILNEIDISDLIQKYKLLKLVKV